MTQLFLFHMYHFQSSHSLAYDKSDDDDDRLRVDEAICMRSERCSCFINDCWPSPSRCRVVNSISTWLPSRLTERSTVTHGARRSILARSTRTFHGDRLAEEKITNITAVTAIVGGANPATSARQRAAASWFIDHRNILMLRRAPL